MQFKSTFLSIVYGVLLFSVAGVFAAPTGQELGVKTLTRRAFVCPKTDDDNSALLRSDDSTGFCVYASSGVCTYFPENGTFSSGASNCPNSLVAGVPNSSPAPVTTHSEAPRPLPQTTIVKLPPPVTTAIIPPPAITSAAPPPPPPSLPPPPVTTSISSTVSSATETLSSSTDSISSTISTTSEVILATTSPLLPATTDTPFQSLTTTYIVVTASPVPTDVTGAAGSGNGAHTHARFGITAAGMVAAVVAMNLGGLL